LLSIQVMLYTHLCIDVYDNVVALVRHDLLTTNLVQLGRRTGNENRSAGGNALPEELWTES